jgi:hypothetical protein
MMSRPSSELAGDLGGPSSPAPAVDDENERDPEKKDDEDDDEDDDDAIWTPAIPTSAASKPSRLLRDERTTSHSADLPQPAAALASTGLNLLLELLEKHTVESSGEKARKLLVKSERSFASNPPSSALHRSLGAGRERHGREGFMKLLGEFPSGEERLRQRLKRIGADIPLRIEVVTTREFRKSENPFFWGGRCSATKHD